MVKSKMAPNTRVRAKQNEPEEKEVVAKKPAANKPANVSLQKAILELECEVKRIAELESDLMLRAILAGRIDLSIAEIADSIEKNFLEGKVIYDSNGAPDPKRSTITANELTRFLDFIRRNLEGTKMKMTKKDDEQHNAESPVEDDSAYRELGYWSAVARDVGCVEDWEYWASQKYLTPRETACLMFELDPKHFDSINLSNNRHFQIGALADQIDKIERSATRETEGKKLSPAKWIEWAQGKGYDVPEKFNIAVAEVEREAQDGAQESDGSIQSAQAPSDDNSENFSQYENWFIPLNTKGLAAMFKVEIDSEDRETRKRGTENLDWWKARMNEVDRLPRLAAARVKRGSYNPAKVADYLVNAGKLNTGQCRRILQNNVIVKCRDDAIAAWGENLT